MKRKCIILIFAIIVLFSFLTAEHWVEGYYRDDGTYVNGYWRTDPDNTVTNNYSYPENYNPNDGININNNYNTDNEIISPEELKQKYKNGFNSNFNNDFNVNTDYEFNNTSKINSTTYARVVRVIDGNTVVVRTSYRKKKTIRIKGIDAPEKIKDMGIGQKENLKY